MGIGEVELARTVERFSFLDDMASYLAMPGAEPDWPYRCPLHELYGGWQDGQENGGVPHVVTLARRINAFVDADKDYWDESLARCIRKMHRIKPLAALGNIPELIWQDAVRARAMIYDLAFVLNEGVGARILIDAVIDGDVEALLKLVKVDKSVLAAPWAAALIEERQYAGDWAFFKRLGHRVRQEPIDKRAGYAKEVLVVALYWEEHFRGCTLEQIVAELAPYVPKLDGAVDYDAFRKSLNRAGLKKNRYNRKVGQVE